MFDFIKVYFGALSDITLEMAPYLLLGFLVSGLLKMLIPANLMNRYLGKSNTQSVINASLFGIPLPLCSCGVLPTGISLFKNGASKGASVSFLISTPQTGVDSVLVTYSMLGLPFAILRPVAALITGLTGGLLTNKLTRSHERPSHQNSESQVKLRFSWKKVLHYAFVEMIADLAFWLVIGLLAAALITTIIPDHFFEQYELTGFAGMVLILLVSIPLYVCATASVPIASALLLKGLSPGAILVFLMAGPATNAATLTVIGKSLGKKTLSIYVSTLIVGSLVLGTIIDLWLPSVWFSPLVNKVGDHVHNLIPYEISVIAAIVLTSLIAYHFVVQLIQFLRKQLSNPNKMVTNKFISVGVEGMTCQHCKATVEQGLQKIPGVEKVIADIEANNVKIFGEALNSEAIKESIEKMNYTYTGVIRDSE